MSAKRFKGRKGISLIEIMVVTLILAVVVIGTSGYRYYAALDARRVDVQITAARLASTLLNNWKGQGGYSGFSEYEAADPTDYDPSDPNDYNPAGIGSLTLVSGVDVYDDAPGPAVPDGFNALDAIVNPNFRIVVNRVNYYATLSYRDPDGEPRLLNVCVAWMSDGGPWDSLKPYQSVTLSTYAND